jgi:hypothetical protein
MKDSGILAAVFHLDVSTLMERERNVDGLFSNKNLPAAACLMSRSGLPRGCHRKKGYDSYNLLLRPQSTSIAF